MIRYFGALAEAAVMHSTLYHTDSWHILARQMPQLVSCSYGCLMGLFPMLSAKSDRSSVSPAVSGALLSLECYVPSCYPRLFRLDCHLFGRHSILASHNPWPAVTQSSTDAENT